MHASRVLKLKLQIMNDNSCDYSPLPAGTTTNCSKSNALFYYLLCEPLGVRDLMDFLNMTSYAMKKRSII